MDFHKLPGGRDDVTLQRCYAGIRHRGRSTVRRKRQIMEAVPVQTEISDCDGSVEFPAKIFMQFFAAHPHRLGAGLAICRSIVETHGRRFLDGEE